MNCIWPIDKFSVKNVWETLKFILVLVKTYWKVLEFLHRYVHKSSIFHSHSALKQFQCFKKRELKQQRRPTATKTSHWLKKVNWRCLQLYRAYSISFNSSNVGQFLWSWTLKDCIKVKGKKEKVVVLCSRPPATKREISPFHVVVVQLRLELNVQKSVMHVLSCCFAYIRLLLFCRSCCRRPRRCLSSLSANKSYHCTHQRYHASLKTTKTEKESYYLFSVNHVSLPEKVTTSIKRIIVLNRFKHLFVLCIIS